MLTSGEPSVREGPGNRCGLFPGEPSRGHKRGGALVRDDAVGVDSHLLWWRKWSATPDRRRRRKPFWVRLATRRRKRPTGGIGRKGRAGSTQRTELAKHDGGRPQAIVSKRLAGLLATALVHF